MIMVNFSATPQKKFSFFMVPHIIYTLWELVSNFTNSSFSPFCLFNSLFVFRLSFHSFFAVLRQVKYFSIIWSTVLGGSSGGSSLTGGGGGKSALRRLNPANTSVALVRKKHFLKGLAGYPVFRISGFRIVLFELYRIYGFL